MDTIKEVIKRLWQRIYTKVVVWVFFLVQRIVWWWEKNKRQ